MNGWISSTICLLLLLSSVCTQKSQDLRCGACRALVDELEWEISRVDQKKTIQIGSFRINPDGSQSILEVPYARSEAHLTELLEHICENMNNYGEKVDPSTHRKNYVRVISFDGTKMDLSETKFDGDVTSRLKFACENIAEEYEDELIEFFSHEAENVKDRLCSKRTARREVTNIQVSTDFSCNIDLFWDSEPGCACFHLAFAPFFEERKRPQCYSQRAAAFS